MKFLELIDGLSRPPAYKEQTKAVRSIQTHISIIFITDAFAYKIKKPVDFGFLNFTTLEKRLEFCTAEVKLNRRLAPNLYIGVVPITLENGVVVMEGSGEAVEYAVKMNIIDEDKVLYSSLKRGASVEAMREDIEKVATAIAIFHGDAERNDKTAKYGELSIIRKNTAENFQQVEGFFGRTLTAQGQEMIKDYTENFISKDEKIFEKRAREGYVRDCHGDIHSEHVIMNDHVEIFDCIEFNERFRFCDVASDIAFLIMDLEYHGRGELAKVLEDKYFQETRDEEGRTLLNFYKCYRAYVRGKVENFRLDEEEETAEDKKEAKIHAILYFYLAKLYASGGFRPFVFVVRGLPGTGKSVIADSVAEYTGAALLRTDAIRRDIALSGDDKGTCYSKEAKERVYKELFVQAEGYLLEGRSVILDATFSRAKHVEEAQRLSERMNCELMVVECEASEKVVTERIRERQTGESLSEADVDVYMKLKRSFEKSGVSACVISTEDDREKVITEVFSKAFRDRE
ncbi:MAG: AAA family ATPase [Deltaproteobacteria bacterium]|nr:AAA family ATPase [Deltaproteobacteria bacterium]